VDRITRLTTCAIEVPIRRELMITSSLGAHAVSRPVLVRLETESGVVGAGEATVTPRWSGETAWGAKAVIDHYLAPAVLGLPVDDIAGALEAMDAAAVLNPFAKSAVETAMLDAWGKLEGKPLYALLGGPVRNRALPIRFSLAAARPETAAENARQRVAWGHRTVKVKVGLNPKADVERVAAVRDAIGPDVALTVDANGGWSVEDAVWALDAMRPYSRLLAEQPVRREDLDGMAEVRRRVDVPIMADESVFTPWDAEQAFKKEACDILSIYPGKNGGVTVSMRIAELAAARGIPCAVGSNLELDPGTAAMCHLAVAARNVDAERYHGDILGTLYQELSVVKDPVRLEAGYAHCPTGPGLGVEVDWERVEALQLD
jgi:L-alanine-DL-glutamate epimerase-like enolase superfamily enzyme